MAVGCGAKFAKIMVIIFNIIFLCSGLVLIALGIWLLVTLGQSYGPSQIFQLASDSYLYRNSAILLIAMGSLIIFVTILGLVAAIRESVILLSIFAALLFIVFAGEIAGGVVAIVYKDRVLETLRDKLLDSLKFSKNTYYLNGTANTCASGAEGQLWDYVQYELKCCGVDTSGSGYESLTTMQINQCDNTTKRYPNMINSTKPLTCCVPLKNNAGNFDPSHQENYWFNCTVFNQEGCVNSVQNWIIRFAPVLIGIGIGFGMLEMFGFIFVICLCMNTDKGFKRF